MSKGGRDFPGSLILCIKEEGMTEILIGGRRIPLRYSAFEMIEIQKQIGCTAFELKDKVFGIRKEMDDDHP